MNNPTVNSEPTVEAAQTRECLLCGRECGIVRKQGALSLKEPCPNKCGAGYIKPRKESQS